MALMREYYPNENTPLGNSKVIKTNAMTICQWALLRGGVLEAERTAVR